MGLRVLMLMAWVEEDKLATLGYESPGQGQEEQEDAARPLGELPVDPSQQREKREEEDLRPQNSS